MMMMMMMIIIMLMVQVGQGDDFVLTVGGFNKGLSTLGDSMKHNNGQNFSTR